MEQLALPRQKSAGHLAAMVTILIWGTTFVCSKTLLKTFLPIEIIFFRFALGYLALLIAYPHLLKTTGWRQELTFAGAGLCGIVLYCLLETTALSYTLASNVSVIISASPFFTAILSRLFLKEEEPMGVSFFIGFVLAMCGIGLISFNGARLQLNPLGDVLSLVAALVWACYSVLSKRISGFGYGTLVSTRRIFLYGILLLIPALFFFPFQFGLSRFLNPVNLGNILFLGLGASALCYVIWGFAIKTLGAVKTSVYIYLIPVVTVVASVLILHEQITWLSGLGIALTLAGLFVSQHRSFSKSR